MMRVKNTFRKIIDCFEENIVVTVLAKLAPLFFKSVLALFCFLSAL